MAPVRERGDLADEAPEGRWQRRAGRRETERRRIPKHGKAYVTLVEQMLAERAREHPARRPAGRRSPARSSER